MSKEKLYLICDCVGSSDIEIISEATSKTGGSELIIRGKFQEADVINKNKRRYPMSVLAPQVDALNEVIQVYLLGELDHPQDSIIHFENCSHRIMKLWWEGNLLMGQAKILDTPSGRILQSLILKEGIKPGISSRGVGSGRMNQEGITEINEGFKLITFDMVADPSTPGAYLKMEYAKSMEKSDLPVAVTTTTPSIVTTEAPAPKQTTKETSTIVLPKESTVESATSNVHKVLNTEVVQGFIKTLFQGYMPSVRV